MARRGLIAAAMLLTASVLAGCSGVVARVNGTDITRKEFTQAMERAAGAQVLQTMIMQKLLYSRAEAEGKVPTDADIQKRFDDWKQETFKGDQTQYLNWLKSTGTDDKVVLDQIKLEMTVYNLRTGHLKPTDEQLKAFFDEHREKQFDLPARVTFRQIVTQSKQIADEVINQLNNEGALFEEMVQRYSMDEKTKAEGGLVTDVDLGLLQAQAKPIYEALTKLQPEQVTQAPVAVDVAPGQRAFVVFKLVRKDAAQPAKWDDPETQKKVREVYLQANAKAEQQLMEEILNGADVRVLDANFRDLIEPKFQPGAQLPPGVQDQLSAPPEMSGPTRIPSGAEPAAANPGDAGLAGGN